jgi:hypothetical protein
VLGGNIREVKCQRALTSGLRQAEEAIVCTAEAHRWTKAALDRALDDVRGRALPHKQEADHFLQAEEQEKKSKWIFECQKMAQNAINLASQTFFWALKWHERSECHLGPKKSRFSGPTPPNAPRNDVAPLKTITYHAIKTTGTLIVNIYICISCLFACLYS